MGNRSHHPLLARLIPAAIVAAVLTGCQFGPKSAPAGDPSEAYPQPGPIGPRTGSSYLPQVPSVPGTQAPAGGSETTEHLKRVARGAAPCSALDLPATLLAVIPTDVTLPPPQPLDSEPKWAAPPLPPIVPKSDPEAQQPAPPVATPVSPALPLVPPAPVANPPLLPPRLSSQPATDDGVVMVGGVPIAIPTDPLTPTGSKTTADGPVSGEPPIRLPDFPASPGSSPAALPPLIQAPAPRAVPLPAQVVGPVLPAIPSSSGAVVAVPSQSGLPAPVSPGPIEVDGQPLPFEALSRLVDGGDFGPPMIGGPCAACGGCGDGQCRAGGHKCDPFPAKTALGRFVGLVYQNICCPDPCYQPRWEPITAAGFFIDAPRPVGQTYVRWDYGNHMIFPDRGEMFWARADGKGKGPKPNAPALGIPYINYHELMFVAEAAAGASSVAIIAPYRSVQTTPWTNSAAGFGDMTITAKNLLWDSELFLFSFQMRTYIPVGQFGKGLGVGHMSLEPGVISGIRVSHDTYAVAEVNEWIPIGGDKDYMGAALRYNFSLNHILWQPVKDVQLIGSLELNGISFQDGAFTDAVAGPLQKLSGQTAIGLGGGTRLFFCDKFDLGVGGLFGVTGKYWAREQMRLEIRYRF